MNEGDGPTPNPSRKGEGDHAGANSPLPLAGGAGGGPATFRRRNTRRAKVLRNNASPPERLLWQHLRNRQLDGHKFSRQMPVGPYFADFLCRDAKLIVELDGSTHDNRQKADAKRDACLKGEGYRLLRFQNGDLVSNIDGVLEAILLALRALPTP